MAARAPGDAESERLIIDRGLPWCEPELNEDEHEELDELEMNVDIGDRLCGDTAGE